MEQVEAPEGKREDERRRRNYALTDTGRRIASAAARRLDALAAAAKSVLGEV